MGRRNCHVRGTFTIQDRRAKAALNPVAKGCVSGRFWGQSCTKTEEIDGNRLKFVSGIFRYLLIINELLRFLRLQV